ncbi:MAG TPA: TIM barrel protein [Acidobacteriaceae bacterium]|nr:TIM barrel protein [Acidobacteriaceae bacterium]
MNRRKFGQLVGATAFGGAFLGAGAQSTNPITVVKLKSPPLAPFAPAPRFSCEIAQLRLNSFDQCVDIMAEAGYQGVELTGYFQKWAPEEQRRILAMMRSKGVVIDMISGLQASFAIPDQSEDFITKLTAHCLIAKALECPQINVKSGKRLDGVDPKVQFAAAVDNLKRASDVADKNGINLVMEPIDLIENPTIFLTSVKDGFEIVRAVDRPNVKVLYDFYHEQRAGGNLIEKLEKNIDWVGLVHIADVPGRHEPGTGEINYANIYRTLGRLHYSRFIAMEYGPTGDPVASLRKAREDAQQALAEGGRAG